MAEFTLTVYGDDDTTPLFEVGTAAGHANPYLHVPDKYRESSVDLLRGGAVIGQHNLRIIDPQNGATKADRWLTAQLGSGTGHSALMRRRALFQRVSPDSQVILDGVVGRIQLSNSFAGFHLEVRDVRERARKVRCFTKGASTSVFPRGIVNGYGTLPSGDLLVRPTTPWGGTVAAITAGVVSVELDDWTDVSRTYPELRPSDALREVTTPTAKNVDGVPIYVYDQLEVWWRAAGSGTWPEAQKVRNVSYTVLDHPVVSTRMVVGVPGAPDRVERLTHIRFTEGSGPATLPTVGADIEIMLVHAGEPSELNPWHYEGTWGELVRNLLRGDYSERNPRIRYDEAALLAIETPVRVRIQEPRDDLRAVLEELHAMIGAAPALNASGELSPIRHALPDSVAGLTVLDETNCQPIPGWEHSGEDAVTVVEVTYARDIWGGITDEDPYLDNPADLLISRPVVVRRQVEAAVLDVMGEQELTVDAWAFRSLGHVLATVHTGSTASEAGRQLAEEFSDRALDRFAYGGSRSDCRVRADAGLEVGQWVLDERPWRPNLLTNQRGGTTLAQVVAVRRLNDAWDAVQLVDAAPSDNPLAIPTLGTPTVSSKNVLTVPVTAVGAGGTSVVVQWAANATEPAADSPLWTHGGRAGAGSSVSVPLMPPSATIWVRARTTAHGRIPSAWVTGGSVASSAGPVLRRASMEVDQGDGSVRFGWDAPAATGGVRIEYVVHVRGSAAPAYTDTLELDAGPETHELAAGTVPPGYRITAELTGWETYAAGSVGGTQGIGHVVEDDRPLSDLTLDVLDVQVVVDPSDGSASITVVCQSGAQSIRLAYNVGQPVAVPTDAEVEAGSVYALTDGEATVALPADTVDWMQGLAARAAAYTTGAGTGEDGTATDHGVMRGALDVRVIRPEDMNTISTSSPSGTPSTGVGSLWLQVE